MHLGMTSLLRSSLFFLLVVITKVSVGSSDSTHPPPSLLSQSVLRGGSQVESLGPKGGVRLPRRQGYACHTARPDVCYNEEFEEDGDSKMGIPTRQYRECLQPGSDPATVAGEASYNDDEVNPPPHRTEPPQSAKPVEFGHVCGNLKKMLISGGNQAHIRKELKEMFCTILASSPDDMTALLCFLRDQISSPTLAGIELIPSSIIVKALAESCGKTFDGVRDCIAQASPPLLPC
ncbi:hypothetical protein GUITHDRAFT_131868 [Guillardia theta CCMP2712]|uniref:Saposin B-type domain-containing protein n=1 Tax=Guillardia theta (strain CCMP2712) TaxID=905079 RepID=L1K3E2_GUITC|nr:hypothetical protein GUITHDRAFT_131868 [Guillardia theta CCMP2712]EKX54878.1 hypothetical protein GUITHDRAFT_131868 [Guillardia theta CCMP2712]|eukprot:XP_005841858.1 hypothetical protein GUITHDRAFT_131868 [Guillardia theta CCMP2712]